MSAKCFTFPEHEYTIFIKLREIWYTPEAAAAGKIAHNSTTIER